MLRVDTNLALSTRWLDQEEDNLLLPCNRNSILLDGTPSVLKVLSSDQVPLLLTVQTLRHPTLDLPLGMTVLGLERIALESDLNVAKVHAANLFPI